MRIPETGPIPRNTPPTINPPPAPSPAASVQSSATGVTTSVSLSERLSSILAELGIEAPPSMIEELAVTLGALGFAPPEIDSENALRAVFLQRNGVLLSTKLLNAPLFPDSPALFRQAGALLDTATTLLGSRELTVEVRAAIETLARDLGTLLGVSVPVSGWGGVSIRDMLKDALMSDTPVPGEPWGSADNDDFGSIFRKSGMAFEWRLLAWFRAGRDPGMLRNLQQRDLKGIIFTFLNGLEKSKGRETRAGKLEEHARTLLDAITARQVTQLLEGTGEQRTLPLVVPADDSRERLYAGVRVDDAKQRDTDSPETEYFSLSLDIETTHLGPVTARLRFSGKTASATFFLKDLTARTLASEMEGEFRDMLRERGYEPGVFHFLLADNDTAYSGERPYSRNSLDIQG